MDIENLALLYQPLRLPQDRVVELDMGCGTGTFSAALAQRYPERLVLAADTLSGRLRKVLQRGEKRALNNLRILRVEARHLIGILLPDRSLGRIHLLCPDPWPKARHKGHRLMTSNFTAQLHRVLTDGGVFHFSSDDGNYCSQVAQVLESSRLFEPFPDGHADVADLRTSFERRWLEAGKIVEHRCWRKRPLPAQTMGH